ncbi:transcriptional regulator [Ralstonia sp. A12]|uniref:helix-turn-helix transcriptional regulator n=1 Tax=Ralstonia sp. A12 TaxID=1217052 RepID=UPI0005741733|nr:helix-turn-helix transcriptional regulator [Ralstonia sp. A12]KHK49836.1 transcriptional regulator [Ralstonia sp. A12]
MNAQVQNDMQPEAVDTTAESRYLSTLPDTAPRWHSSRGAPLTMNVRHASMTSIASAGVILLDLSELVEAVGALPPPQPMTLEQAHVMLGRILEARRQALAAASRKSTALSVLTPRQRDILHEAASGKSNADIAQTLHIGVETVKSHVREILMRLQARNRTELAALYQHCVGEIRARGSH